MAELKDIGVFNLLCVMWMLICWFGYAQFARKRSRHIGSLSSVLHVHRINWMRRMMLREVRVGDAALLANVERNVNFFASSCVLIIAGLLTALTATAEIQSMLNAVSFISKVSVVQIELKILTLVAIFIYAYFTFTWSMRQFGFASVLIGAAPAPDDVTVTANEKRSMAIYSAKVIDLASNSYNNGLRAFYFSIAVLSWFISPIFFIASSALVTTILYQREFRSSALSALKKAENVGEKLFKDDKDLYRP
ncbi:MAG: DUF599 domain-containing protein [Oleibacter sp.]|nr:DUF599 domain-containing protein [Thalassolituus sp.]